MKKTYTIIEYLDDNETWTWWAIYDNATPKEAIKEYCKEHGLKGKITKEQNDFYCIEADVRAYEVNMSHI